MEKNRNEWLGVFNKIIPSVDKIEDLEENILRVSTRSFFRR